MDYQVVADEERVFVKFGIARLQAQRLVWAGGDTHGLAGRVPPVETEIADVDKLRHVLGIDRAVGAGMGA